MSTHAFLDCVVDSGGALPAYAHEGDAGLDLRALQGGTLAPHTGHLARTGVSVEIPPGHVGLLLGRSSLGAMGMHVVPGVIDSGYRGEVRVSMRSLSELPIVWRAGDKIAQLLILPVATVAVRQVDQLTETARGVGGFGSTGR